VRVDILERLADLIRPALSWKPGTGARPEGALDGNAFLVTPAMMSILGATAADMEEILKGLGYRAEPKPESEVKARIEALETVATPAAPAEAPVEAAAGDESETISDETAGTNSEAAAAPEAEVTSEPTAEPASEPVAEVAPAAEAAHEAAPAEPEEDKIVLLWRPGRPEGRPRHQNRRPQRGREGGQSRDAAGDQQQPAGRQRDQQRHARPRDGEERRERPKGGGGFKGKGPRPERGDRPRKDERPAGDKRDFTEQRAPRREADPDSPFAKLAALRDQLKK
jgi:ATP-dependent RNA helicase SUPV3L1/SUV3